MILGTSGTQSVFFVALGIHNEYGKARAAERLLKIFVSVSITQIIMPDISISALETINVQLQL